MKVKEGDLLKRHFFIEDKYILVLGEERILFYYETGLQQCSFPSYWRQVDLDELDFYTDFFQEDDAKYYGS